MRNIEDALDRIEDGVFQIQRRYDDLENRVAALEERARTADANHHWLRQRVDEMNPEVIRVRLTCPTCGAKRDSTAAPVGARRPAPPQDVPGVTDDG